MEGKTAVVTGGSGLIGRAFCEALTTVGVKVINADIDTVDLSSEQSIVEWAKGVDKVDILINNAAVKSKNFFAPLESYTLADWNEVIAVNLTAMFLVVRELAPVLAKGASIINMSSIYGILAPDQRIYKGDINTPLVYSVSKAGVIGFTKYLSTYWTDKRTNCIVPGGVYDGQDADFVERYSARVPMGKMATVDDIVGAMMFLVQNQYINGQALVIDGGLSVW